MNIAKLLPDRQGKPVGQWLQEWLLEVLKDARSIVSLDNAPELRDRNEKLSSYLPTLVVVMGAYKQFMDAKRKEYVQAFPKPEKGVTEWREAFDAQVSDARRITDLIEGLIETIGTRISVTQTNLRTLGEETRGG